jgi:hypothetical protein
MKPTIKDKEGKEGKENKEIKEKVESPEEKTKREERVKTDKLFNKYFPFHPLHERNIIPLFTNYYRVNYMYEGWHKNSFFCKVLVDKDLIEIWFDNPLHETQYNNMIKDIASV